MKYFLSTLILLFYCFPSSAVEPLFQDVIAQDILRLKKTTPEAFQGELTHEELDQLIRELMSTGQYERVSAQENDSGKLEIVAKPLRLVKQVTFAGNSALSSTELNDISELKISEKFDRRKILKAGEAVKQLYADNGYFNAVIEVNFLRQPDNNLKIAFNINEKAPCRIADIVVTSENTELNDRLNKLVRSYKKKTLTSSTIEKISGELTQFLLEKRYLRTQYDVPSLTYNEDKTSASVRFELKEPYRYEIYFENMEKKQHRDNSQLYRRAQLDSYERPSEDPASEVSEKIRRYYLGSGYPNIKVESRIVDMQQTFVRRVYITVDEGVRVKINSIDIQGRLSRATSYYSDFIRKNSSKLIEKGYYNRDDLENGYKNLITQLRNEGHLRAKIQSARIEYSLEKNKANILVLLDEGPLTQIRAIRFEGATAFSHQELLNAVGLRTQAPLKLNDLEQSLQKLKDYYLSRGYLEARLLNDSDSLVEYNDKGTQATINYKIFEGPRVQVIGIAIEGNTFTKDRVIRREIDIRSGDVLTPEKIDESISRLNKMGIFSRVSIRTLEEGTNVANRNVIVSVTERDPGTLRFGIGANSERTLTLSGNTGISYSNLFGTARAVSARLKVSSNVAKTNYPEHEVTLGYFEPFLAGTRTRGRANYTRSEVVRTVDEQNELTTILASDRFDFLLERDLTRYIKLTWKLWSLDSRKEFERNDKVPEEKQQVAKIGPVLDLDYRDNSFLPTQGSYSRFSIDYTHPNLGSTDEINFVRSEALYTHYLRLFNSNHWVWANSVRGGWVKNLGNEVTGGVPASDAFILGGLNSVRGFDGTISGDRIPRADELVIDRSIDLVIRTQSTFYMIKSELRFPLYKEHGAAFFYDGGAVQIPDYDIAANRTGNKFSRNYHDSAGFGYRYNTPVGPVSLDIAFKLNPDPDKTKYRFHFSIGTF